MNLFIIIVNQGNVFTWIYLFICLYIPCLFQALFIVRVSYFVQVVVFYGLLKRSVTLKLPFILTRPEPEKVLPSNIKDEQNDNCIDEPKRM